MSPEEASHAFDRFWQAGGDASTSGRGAGLGLSIVAAHGGEIDLDATPGKGATFTITAASVRSSSSLTVRRRAVIIDG